MFEDQANRLPMYVFHYNKHTQINVNLRYAKLLYYQ